MLQVIAPYSPVRRQISLPTLIKNVLVPPRSEIKTKTQSDEVQEGHIMTEMLENLELLRLRRQICKIKNILIRESQIGPPSTYPLMRQQRSDSNKTTLNVK